MIANHVRIASTTRMVVLLFAPALVALAIGWALAGVRGGLLAPVPVCGLLLILYRVRDRVALALLRARRAAPAELMRVRPLLADVSHRAGLSEPRVYVIDDVSAASCAVGGNAVRAGIVVTTGLLAHLGDRELRAVLAAEAALLARRDLTPAMCAVALTGALLLPVTLLRWGRPSRWADAERHHGNGVVYVALLVLLPLAMLVIMIGGAGAAAYATDATAARLCDDPRALARALRRIAQIDWLHPPTIAFAVAPLCLVHPFGSVRLLDLLDIRPSLLRRIDRLHALDGQWPSAS